jgi:hypothetical protein
VTGVKTIRITSNVEGGADSFIQVAGVVATEAETGLNLALARHGAVATAFSSYDVEATPDKAIDGHYPAGFPDIFHSGGMGSDEYLEIILAAPSALASITIFGRADSSSHRDIFAVTLMDEFGLTLLQGEVDGSALAGQGGSLIFPRLVSTFEAEPEASIPDTPPPPPPPEPELHSEPPKRRGWLARLFGFDR